MRIAVIGAGNWGTALAAISGQIGHEVILWSRDPQVAESINSQHVNSQHLRQCYLPDNVSATAELHSAVSEARLVVLAIPSQATRAILEQVRSSVSRETLFVGAMKGIEVDSCKRMSEVVTEVLGDDLGSRYVCLSGPSFAQEVIAGHPTAVVAAGKKVAECQFVQQQLSFETLRIYTNTDLAGVELGGATKNVMAIAAGMVAGLGFGSNSIAALITRGLAEMTRLTLKQGGKRETLMGLAGLGDLVLTCTGSLSRNRYVGHELGRGRTLAEISSEMNEVAEGVKTTAAVKKLARAADVEMPIVNEVYAVLYEQKFPREAVAQLMTRPLREEFGIE
jgi:glycerol-3-phosphate dehydrogenase (NAD(P)+)